MDKLENVIKGIAQCFIDRTIDKYEAQCWDCPYFDKGSKVDECTKKLRKDVIELLENQQAKIKALKEEKEKTESNFAEYVDEKREEVEELNAKIKRLEFELKKYEELVSVLKNKA